MAASRIKGITVEIGGDTTKLQTALKGVNSEIKNTQSQLKDVEKLLKLDPSNTELLAQKQKLLSSAVSETKEKLATLKTAAEQANQALANGDISKLEGAIKNCDGMSQKMAETMQDNLSGQLTILKSQLQELAISFADLMMPAIRSLVSALQGLVDFLNKLPEPVKQIILIVVLLVAALGPVLIFVGKIMSASALS